MAGTINSLGVGSGVLTSDIIDKLKANDKTLTIDPIEKKIKLNQQKTDALNLLDSLMSSFKSSASSLADDTIFANRTVSGNIEGISVSADKGVDVQSFSISDTSLAKTNILEASGFSDPTDKLATGDGTLNINIGGKDYVIKYDNETTLQSLKSSINTVAGTGVHASILQVDDNNYSLVINSKNTGLDEAVSIIDLGGKLKDSSIVTDNFASGSFSSSSTKISSATSGSMDLTIGDSTYQFAYDSNTTLSQMADLINKDDTISDKVHASIVKYDNSDYRLVITSKSPMDTKNLVVTDNGSGLGDALKSDSLVSSATFAAKDALIATNGTPNSTGSFRVSIDGGDYDFAYDETTTLQNLADNINADATLSSKIHADIVKYGASDYRLVLSNLASTQDSTISTSDQISTGSGLVANLVGGSYTNASSSVTDGGQAVIQDSKDATFKYNGIKLTRSSNEISDISSGVTITLSQENKSTNISITQDKSAVSDELDNFKNSYNTLLDQLDKMTTSDSEKGVVGIFNGDNSINAIRREINKVITNFTQDGHSITQFGISLDEKGAMSFSLSDFNSKFDESPDVAQKFFSGETTVDNNGVATYTNGAFDNLNDLLNNYLKSSGYISNMKDGYSNELSSLESNHTRSLKMLNSRYDTMTKQFIEYDTIINRLNNQFSSLNSMIQAQLNGK